MPSPRSRSTGKLKNGQHRSTHPWEAGWRNKDMLPDRERFGLGEGRGCKTLADMTPEEIAAIEREYGAKVVER